MRDKEWVVYAQEPIRAPQQVLAYLARYVSRVAISNHRLVALHDGKVTFRYKDYKRGHRLRTRTLDAVEFVRRVMLHVPPHGLQRIRHFGLLANRVRKENLAQCRTLLGQASPPRVHDEVLDAQAHEASPAEPGSLCPVCHCGRMQLVRTMHRRQAAWDLSAAPPGVDTS